MASAQPLPAAPRAAQRGRPGLPFEDGHFDVVWALSVFTHLVDTWAPWLLELHRVLADDGILIATTIGPRHSERFANEGWDEDRIGMNALRSWAAYPHGAPVVLHSTWWLRAHWGRAFEILEMSESRRRGLPPIAGLRCESATSPSPSRTSSARSPASRASSPPSVTTSDSCDGSSRRLTTTARPSRDRRPRKQDPRPREAGRRPREQEKLLRAMLDSRAFAVAERLSRLRQGGRPLFSREQIRRALGDQDGPA